MSRPLDVPVSLAGRVLAPGAADGSFVVLDVPLSFWGGLDPATGLIIDRSHPACGQSVRGAILAMPSGRGSSSSSSVLAEAIRRGTAPAGIVLGEPDPIIAVGAMVARRLYGSECPVLQVDFGSVQRWGAARITAEAGGAGLLEGRG